MTAPDKSWTVYIAECKDGSFYTGISKNVAARLDVHNSGKGAKYTRSRRPIILKRTFGPFEHGQALRIEAKIKKLRKPDKLSFNLDETHLES